MNVDANPILHFHYYCEYSRAAVVLYHTACMVSGDVVSTMMAENG